MAWFISDFQNKWIFKSLELDILSSKLSFNKLRLDLSSKLKAQLSWRLKNDASFSLRKLLKEKNQLSSHAGLPLIKVFFTVSTFPAREIKKSLGPSLKGNAQSWAHST